MARFLTDEWVDALRAIVPSVGETRVECSVVGGHDGDVKFHLAGNDVGVGALADADVVFTATYADATAIVRAELQPSVAFMQGRLKTAGDPGRLLELLAVTATPAFRGALERVAATTEF